MLALLIVIGRFSVGLAAVVVIIMSTVVGWFYGEVSNNQFPGAIAGFLLGLLTAGSIFGLAAAVFDMHRTLRLIAGRHGASVFDDDDWERRSVNRTMASKIEPRV